MKLNVDETRSMEPATPLELFHQGITNEVTDAEYTWMLKRTMCEVFEDLLEGTYEERVDEFVERAQKDPTWARQVMLGMSDLMRKKTELDPSDSDYLNPSTIPAYFAPVKKLLDMNDVALPWKRIYKTFPKKNNRRILRGWSLEEIRDILKHCGSSKYRAMVLVLASSGVRVGGSQLRWDDIEPMYKVGDKIVPRSEMPEKGKGSLACASVRVYVGSTEEHTTFLTPEAYGALLDYAIKWEADVGRPPRADDPVFKTDGIFPKPISTQAIQRKFRAIVRDSGVRKKHEKKGRRFDVPLIHGFRSFWNKVMKDAVSDDSPVSSLTKKEYMMGHSGFSPLDRSYYYAHRSELAKEYMHAIPELTVGEDERLRLSNARKDVEIVRLKSEALRIAKLEEMVAELTGRVGP